jgi:hypothetical protein
VLDALVQKGTNSHSKICTKALGRSYAIHARCVRTTTEVKLTRIGWTVNGSGRRSYSHACKSDHRSVQSCIERHHDWSCARARALVNGPAPHLTVSVATWLVLGGPLHSSPPWLSMSTRGTSIRTPTPPPSAALANVLECTTCSDPASAVSGAQANTGRHLPDHGECLSSKHTAASTGPLLQDPMCSKLLLLWVHGKLVSCRRCAQMYVCHLHPGSLCRAHLHAVLECPCVSFNAAHKLWQPDAVPEQRHHTAQHGTAQSSSPQDRLGCSCSKKKWHAPA